MSVSSKKNSVYMILLSLILAFKETVSGVSVSTSGKEDAGHLQKTKRKNISNSGTEHFFPC